MSELEREDDVIIKQAKELITENKNTIYLTEDQKKEVSEGSDKYDAGKSFSYAVSMDKKKEQTIIYNIKRKDNKLAEISLLAKALQILERRDKLIKSQITQINNKWIKRTSDDNELQNLNNQNESNTSDINSIIEHLNIYESLKTGGKRKTKKYNFRRHKSKKNKKLKLKN